MDDVHIRVQVIMVMWHSVQKSSFFCIIIRMKDHSIIDESMVDNAARCSCKLRLCKQVATYWNWYRDAVALCFPLLDATSPDMASTVFYVNNNKIYGDTEITPKTSSVRSYMIFCLANGVGVYRLPYTLPDL